MWSIFEQFVFDFRINHNWDFSEEEEEGDDGDKHADMKKELVHVFIPFLLDCLGHSDILD